MVQTGVMYLDSSDLELMHDGLEEQVVVVVFPRVQVPQNAGVAAAAVRFVIDEVVTTVQESPYMGSSSNPVR
eukprot:3186531-Prymnesium_polylepis.1